MHCAGQRASDSVAFPVSQVGGWLAGQWCRASSHCQRSPILQYSIDCKCCCTGLFTCTASDDPGPWLPWQICRTDWCLGGKHRIASYDGKLMPSRPPLPYVGAVQLSCKQLPSVCAAIKRQQMMVTLQSALLTAVQCVQAASHLDVVWLCSECFHSSLEFITQGIDNVDDR